MLIENVLLAKVSESCHRGETEIPETKLVIEVTNDFKKGDPAEIF